MSAAELEKIWSDVHKAADALLGDKRQLGRYDERAQLGRELNSVASRVRTLIIAETREERLTFTIPRPSDAFAYLVLSVIDPLTGKIAWTKISRELAAESSVIGIGKAAQLLAENAQGI